MESLNKNQLRSVVGGFDIQLKVCQTGKIISPPITTDSKVTQGLNTVLNNEGAANGFQGVDIGLNIGGNFVPIGANLCP